MTRILLARHGETEWNAVRRVQGWTDIPLSEKGQAQAEALAQRLSRTPLAAVYSSDLSRAVQTAAPVAARQGLTVQTRAGDARKGLRRLGRADAGRPRARLPGPMASVSRRPRPGRARPRRRDLAPGTGAAFCQCLRRILAAHPGPDEAVLLVGHGGSGRMVILEALGASLPTLLRLHLDNASLSRLDFRGVGDSRVLFLNDTSHLEGLDLMTGVVLGLDGGGTQTRVAVATASGRSHWSGSGRGLQSGRRPPARSPCRRPRRRRDRV